MQVVLPREADAAVHLERGGAHPPAGVRRVGLGRSRRPASAIPARSRRTRPRSTRPSAIPRPRAASARNGAKPPGRRRSGGRTACARARRPPPSPWPAEPPPRSRPPPPVEMRSGRTQVTGQRIAALCTHASEAAVLRPCSRMARRPRPYVDHHTPVGAGEHDHVGAVSVRDEAGPLPHAPARPCL